MKKIFTLFLALVVSMGTIYAQSTQVDGIWYYFDSETKTATVTSEVFMVSSYYTDSVVIPSTVTYNGVTYSVTSIGMGAFYYCTSLTSVTIPNSITHIEWAAFYNTGIYNNESNWDNGVLYVDNCLIATLGDISSVYTVKEETRLIADLAFYWCSSLTSVTIPNNVTNIGGGIFGYCKNLQSVVLPENITSLSPGLNDVEVYGFFEGCSSLTSITLNSTTPPAIDRTYSDGYAFEGVDNSIPIYVPCGCVDSYKRSDWSYFSNIQEPLAEYSINLTINDSNMGTVQVDKNNVCGNQISATANYGYHFVQWSDGSTDNPRSLELTRDTVLTAEFAPNNYTLSVQSDNSERGTTSGDVTTTYLDYVTISATANYGYHFSHWNDYNYDNPRQVQVTEDKTYTAYFDKNTYYITKNYDSNQGYVDGYSSGEYLDNITLTAEANYGYHFVQWSDGVTDNPRSFVLTQDTTFVAVFAPNNYTISTLSSDIERGTTSGDITTTYLDYVTISATANYGYHFSCWDDYNYDNPRQVQVTEDKTYTAYFDKNTYYITKNYDSNQGYVDGYSSGEYLDNITLIAEPNYGYHFVRWSDGNTDNPRHFILTQDTTFSAEFAQTFSGQCGDNLYWSYQNNSLIISGFGEMYDERPWGLFTNEIQTMVLPNGITHIGNDAFSDCIGLNEITIPYTVTSIGDYAFAGCRKLVQVNCYAINPPLAESTSFANYNVYLNVPCDNLQDYQLDMVFGSFKYIQCMEADSENVPTDDVVVTPGTNDVTITWPIEGNADTYTIVIKKGNEVFCTLTFNAEGQLLNIAFAPSRDGNNRPAQYAEQAGNGYRFTVTGLEAGTNYTYDITVKDASNQTINSHIGEFSTQSTTAVDNITTNNANIQKIIRNGQLLIIRDGKTYNIMGAEIR